MQSKSLTFANKYFFAYKPSIKFVGKRTPGKENTTLAILTWTKQQEINSFFCLN